MERRQLVIVAGALATLALCVIAALAVRGGSDDSDARGDVLDAPIAMTRERARDYLERLGYPNVQITDRNRLVTAQDDYCATAAECQRRKPKIVFDYSDRGERPRCIIVTHSYALDWRSIVAKLTGIAVEHLPEIGEGQRGPVEIEGIGATTVFRSETRVSVGTGCA
jgi:hypothetical protein